jgi:hypothetical protein
MRVRKKSWTMNATRQLALGFVALLALLLPSFSRAAEGQTEWEKTLAAAKKEGTVVVGIPASSELRTAIGTKFKEKFGIATELLSARGPENVTRIITEFNAGVRYFDILVAGGATPLSMVAAGAADDFQSYMILPEVKDPKNWWGTSGKITWAANGKFTHFSATRAKHCGTTAVKSNPMRFVRSTICSIPSGKAESAFSIRAIPVRDKTRGLFYGK